MTEWWFLIILTTPHISHTPNIHLPFIIARNKRSKYLSTFTIVAAIWFFFMISGVIYVFIYIFVSILNFERFPIFTYSSIATLLVNTMELFI